MRKDRVYYSFKVGSTQFQKVSEALHVNNKGLLTPNYAKRNSFSVNQRGGLCSPISVQQFLG